MILTFTKRNNYDHFREINGQREKKKLFISLSSNEFNVNLT